MSRMLMIMSLCVQGHGMTQGTRNISGQQLMPFTKLAASKTADSISKYARLAKNSVNRIQQISEKNQTRLSKFFRRPGQPPTPVHKPPATTDATTYTTQNSHAPSTLHNTDTRTSHKRLIRTTQSLLTEYFREQAPNIMHKDSTTLSPLPT